MSDTALAPASMLEAALNYARAGWPVFPCEWRVSKRAKRPLVADADRDADGNKIPETGGLWRATTDEAQIRAWWSQPPKALIGVPTGKRIGLFVIDLDPRDGETAADVLGRLIEAVGDLPMGPKSITQSGGIHLWFRNPEGDLPRNSAKRIRGVDWRGHGGYVIVPPGRLSNGKAYVWDQSPRAIEFPEPPARLLDLVFQRGDFARAQAKTEKTEPSRPVRSISTDSAGDKAVRRYAQGALDRARSDVASCPQGQRGHTLNAAAYGLAPFITLGVLSEREVTAALQDGADICGLT